MAAAANYAWVNRSSMTFLSRQVNIKKKMMAFIQKRPSIEFQICQYTNLVITPSIILRRLPRYFRPLQMTWTCTLYMMCPIILLKSKNMYPFILCCYSLGALRRTDLMSDGRTRQTNQRMNGSGEAKHIATGHAMQIYNCLNFPRQL